MNLKRILIIQTAFIGDVILATAVLEKWHEIYPDAKIDMMIRKGNEGLFEGHPYLNKLIIWEKKKDKLKNLLRACLEIRRNKYDVVINLHRFFSSGLMVLLSGARIKSGFSANSLSLFYTHRYPHNTSQGLHEVERNQNLISNWTGSKPAMPRLYPQPSDTEKVKSLKLSPYICIAPGSVWPTKQLPLSQWIPLLQKLPEYLVVYLIGAASDQKAFDELVHSRPVNTLNLAGRLSLLQSAALMKDAMINYVNDSAPLHIASAMNAPVAAIFCSTVPVFGFGPLSSESYLIETEEKLACRPCGLAGKSACPYGHFKCAKTITNEQLFFPMEQRGL